MTLVTLAQHLNSDPAKGYIAGDLVADARGIKLAFGADAAVVLISNACRQEPGEDLLQPARGIPRAMLLGKGASLEALRDVYVRKIAATSTVTSVPSCTATREGDAIRLTIEVETTEGRVSAAFGMGV